ncbi:TPA: hypothetical protein DCG86_06030 [Candidatus Marinimicrobia bacterium]|nr:hypothetical protein [Candidatus Neomarinimicrobiota bacterium]HBY18140.1 hypothetical protein [Candidatus Neomarinimicrobiota bacterium]
MNLHVSINRNIRKFILSANFFLLFFLRLYLITLNNTYVRGGVFHDMTGNQHISHFKKTRLMGR